MTKSTIPIRYNLPKTEPLLRPATAEPTIARLSRLIGSDCIQTLPGPETVA